MDLLWILAYLVLFSNTLCAQASSSKYNMVHTLNSDFDTLEVKENFDLQIFCRLADKKTPLYFFRSATLRIGSSAEDIKLIKGPTADDVYRQYKSSTWLFWMANLLPWRMRDASFPTFNTSCVGISTNQPYSAKLVIKYADPWKVTIFIAGVVLFFLSPKLTKSTVFFYSSATVVGAIGAALLFLFLITKFLPRGGRGSYVTISLLYSLVLYFAGETWNRFEQLLQERLPYVIIYLTIGAVVSLISCYRFGPPTNVKTLNIIQWSLQLFGLALIHLSSDLIEVSTCVIVLLITYRVMYAKLLLQFQKLKFRLFPPKRKLLTEEEFINQGAVETEKGLDELRKFCNSPDCNAWKVVSRLKNPKRFIEGSSHLDDDEIMAYDSENEALEEAAAADLLTDDDNSSNVTDDEA